MSSCQKYRRNKHNFWFQACLCVPKWIHTCLSIFAQTSNIFADVAYIPLPSLLLLIKLLQHVQNCVTPNSKSNYYFWFFLTLYRVQWMPMYIFKHPFFLHVFGPLMKVWGQQHKLFSWVKSHSRSYKGTVGGIHQKGTFKSSSANCSC